MCQGIRNHRCASFQGRLSNLITADMTGDARTSYHLSRRGHVHGAMSWCVVVLQRRPSNDCPSPLSESLLSASSRAKFDRAWPHAPSNATCLARIVGGMMTRRRFERSIQFIFVSGRENPEPQRTRRSQRERRRNWSAARTEFEPANSTIASPV